MVAVQPGKLMSKCEWRSERDEDYRCRVAAEEGSTFCIFHQPGEKDIERFKQAFYSQIREEGPADERNSQYDFRGYVFPTDLTVQEGEETDVILPGQISGDLIIGESTIEGHAFFWNATIKGNAFFEGTTIEGEAYFEGATIEGYVYFGDATIEGGADFTDAKIEGDADFRGAKIKGGASFKGAKIGGDVCFEDATIAEGVYFESATIEGYASFAGAVIKSYADFLYATIKGYALFSGVMIERDAIFLCATIGAFAIFELGTIQGEANFGGVTIGGHTNFEGVTIGGDADFGGVTIGEDADFAGVTILGDADFGRTEIGGDADFEHGTIEGKADFGGATIGRNADFAFKRLRGEFRLTNTSIRRLLRFRDPVFHERISFDHCVAGGLDLGEGKPTIRGWGQKRSGVTLTDVSTGYSFWRFARLTFEKEGQKHEADAAHYFERMWRWKALRHIPLEGAWHKQSFRRILRLLYTVLCIFDCVFIRWTTQYGASLSRIFVTWGLLINAFAAVYHLVGVRLFDPLPYSTGLAWPLSFGRALYFSIITFTTLGYGDIKPTPGWGSALTATEAILGGIMMALTVLVIGRKFMR